MDNDVSSEEYDRKIAQVEGISEFHLRVVTSVSCVLAVLAVAGRLAIRLYTRRRLFLDDVFVIFGLGCLCTATALSYRMTRTLPLGEALRRYSDIVIPAEQNQSLLSDMEYAASVFCLVWTTTFAVKFSFLVLFWQLLQRVSKWLTKYYWVVVGTCVISWLFVLSEPFVLCQYFGLSTVRCFSKIHNQLNISLTSLVNTLDIITDIMIVSIPIILLGRTQLRISQKISLGVFLCLSAAMIAIAGARFSVLHNSNLVWTYLWQYIEACVACIMASLQTFRTLFFNGSNRIFKQQELREHLPSNMRRVSPNLKLLNMGAWERGEDEKNELPEIPPATFSGVRNFIRRYHRSPGFTTPMNTEEG